MCVKFSPENLNSNPYPSHLISTNICEMTTAPFLVFDSLKNELKENYHLTSFI